MSSAPFCTHGNLPYSTKWSGSTLGLVPLILYSRPVPHQQVHILPIKDAFPPSTFALSAPCLGLVTTSHLPYSIKWGGPTLGLVCLILYSRPVPHKQTHQQDPVTTTKIHWPPSLLYKMGWPNPWACVSDFVQQACPTQASTPARPSHIHQVPPHPAYQRCPSTLHLCPLSHLPSLGHHWPPSLLYKMGGPNPWACVSDFVQQACPTPAGAPARPCYSHHILPIKDTSPPSTFALSAPCLGLVTTGHLPCSTKWGGPTLRRGLKGQRWRVERHL